MSGEHLLGVTLVTGTARGQFPPGMDTCSKRIGISCSIHVFMKTASELL
ncbi:hypothetical protein [Neobacillus niacini]